MEEVWKIKENFDRYEISNFGQIRTIERYYTDSIGRNRLNKSIILKPVIGKDGYYKVVLIDNLEKRCTFRINRLVAELYIENPYNFLVVNHLDGNKLNNTYTNLEWTTHLGNNQHAKETGLHSINIPIIQQTLSGEFVAEFYSTRDAQKATNIDGSCISKVCKGQRKSAGGYSWKYK